MVTIIHLSEVTNPLVGPQHFPSLDQLSLALYWYLHTFKWKAGHKTLSWIKPTFGKYSQLGPLHPSSPSPQNNLDIVESKIFWKFTTQPPQMKSILFYLDHDRPLWKAKSKNMREGREINSMRTGKQKCVTDTAKNTIILSDFHKG